MSDDDKVTSGMPKFLVDDMQDMLKSVIADVDAGSKTPGGTVGDAIKSGIANAVVANAMDGLQPDPIGDAGFNRGNDQSQPVGDPGFTPSGVQSGVVGDPGFTPGGDGGDGGGFVKEIADSFGPIVGDNGAISSNDIAQAVADARGQAVDAQPDSGGSTWVGRVAEGMEQGLADTLDQTANSDGAWSDDGMSPEQSFSDGAGMADGGGWSDDGMGPEQSFSDGAGVADGGGWSDGGDSVEVFDAESADADAADWSE